MTSAAKPAVFLSIAILALAGCEEGLNLGGGSSNANTDASAALAPGEVQSGVKDVERPDIFSTEELALWDGRPSLGGIWVAHPDVTEPERAILINVSTGQRVAGALFRRERDNPGPRIQLSSDAAAALNILAGQPTEVSIIAVRQEEIIIETPPPVLSDEEVGADGATESEDGSDAGEAAAAGAVAGAATADAKPRGNFFQRLFGRKKPANTRGEDVPLEETAASAAAPKVETAPLDPVATGAAAAIARAEASDKPAPRPERQTAAPASGLRNPFIQVGLFNVEANAGAATANLRQAGIVPTVMEGTRDGNPFWRIVVGPVSSADDQAALLAQVKQLGFDDAFLAPN